MMMMKALIFKILLAAGLLVAAVTGFPFKKLGTKSEPEPATFYFYPAANVYYDVSSREFIFQNDDNQWQKEPQLPESKKAALEKNVVLNNPPLPVWQDNDQHRMIYAVTLFAQPSDFIDKPKPEVRNKKDEEIVASGKEDSSRKESRIKKFFKGLFSRKDKKKKAAENNGGQ